MNTWGSGELLCNLHSFTGMPEEAAKLINGGYAEVVLKRPSILKRHASQSPPFSKVVHSFFFWGGVYVWIWMCSGV